jgi:hypothetical protein
VRRRGRPGCRPTARTAPSTWPSCSTTCPSSSSGSRRPRWPAPSWSVPTPPTGATSLVRDLSHTECQFLITDSTYLPLVEGARIGDALGDGGATTTACSCSTPKRPGAHWSHTRRPPPRVWPIPVGDTRIAGLPPLHLGDFRRAQGVPVQPGPAGAHRRPSWRRCTRSSRPTSATSPCRCSTPTRSWPVGGRRSWPDRPSPSPRRAASPLRASSPTCGHAGATYFNYVGKPLSYILATPEQPDDADNPLVRAFGNEGSTDDVARFAERFGVAVTDSYGSTEGGATVQRTPDTPPGALGRAPEGTVVLNAATGRSARRPASTAGPAAQRRGGDRRARLQGRRCRLRGLLAQRRRRDGPPPRRAGTGRATWPIGTRPASSTSPGATMTGCASTGRTSPRRRSSGSCSAIPTSCSPPSTPCPTPRGRPGHGRRAAPARRRLARRRRACRIPGRAGRPGHQVGAPLRAHERRTPPHDATNKVLKRSLRAERWNCEEPVLWQSDVAATLEAAVGDRPI